MENDLKNLRFFISEKNSIVVLSLAGLLYKDSIPVLSDAQSEVVSKSPKWVLLLLNDLSGIDPSALSALTRLQKAIRDIPAKLRICGLNPKLKSLLEEKGLLRRDELVENLNDAIMDVGRLSAAHGSRSGSSSGQRGEP